MNDQRIPVPLLSENYKLRAVMCDFLENAHESTKKKLAEMRKTNQMPKSAHEPKKRERKHEEAILSMVDENTNPPNDNKVWIYRINDSELLECFPKSKREKIKLNTHLTDIINKYKKFILFRDSLENLPAASGAIISILEKMIKEKDALQENTQELYELLYNFCVLHTIWVDYSEKLEMPGYNVIEIMPGGSLIKLPMPFKEIGYERLGLKKSICKRFQELWGIPNNHITFHEYYPEIWRYYENHYEKKYQEKHGIP
jgi:hypothetical protein